VIPPGVPPPLEVHAEHLVYEDGTLVASGGVTLTRAGQTLDAEQGVFDLDERVLTLSGGSLTRGPVEFSFAEATFAVDTDEALLEGVVADGLGWYLTGARLLVLPDGALVVEDAVATVCEPACGHRLPWVLEARSAHVDPGRTLRVQGGLIRVFGLPLVPVPSWFTSLDPHEPHLEAPVLGWVDGHPAVRLPVRWGHPRGLRMRATLGYWRGPASDLSAAWGEDSWASTDVIWVDGALRGQASVHHVQVDTGLRVGVDGQLVSDPAWLTDRGRSWVARTAPWSDVRAISGFGPARLELIGVQTEAPTVRWIPAAVLTTGTRARGPVLGAGTARFDLVDGELRSEAGGETWAVHRGAVFEAEAGVSARALAYAETPGGVDGAARAEVRLPLWREGALGTQEWAVGLRADGGQHWGPEAAHAWEAWDTGLRLGPQLETVAWGPGGTHGWARIWVPWDREAWGVEGTGRLARGPLAVGGQVAWRDGEGLMAGRVGWTGGVGGLWAQVALEGGETLEPLGRAGGWASLTTGHSGWDLTGQLLADGVGLGEARAGVAWRSGCECMLIGTGVGWARDQAGPSVSLRLDVTP
jgi:hypothetical protein